MSVLGKTDDGLLVRPHDARLLYVFAHGPGGNATPFSRAGSGRLRGTRHRTYRYEFPYMQAGKNRPDSPGVAAAAVRAAVVAAAHRAPDLRSSPGGSRLAGE